MNAAVAADEYLWNGITYDPYEPDVTGYIIIPDLPPVVGSEVACPGCGQTLTVICGVDLAIPQRHYQRPTTVQLHGGGTITRVGTVDSGRGTELAAALGPLDGDMLNGVIARAQHAAAMVSA